MRGVFGDPGYIPGVLPSDVKACDDFHCDGREERKKVNSWRFRGFRNQPSLRSVEGVPIAVFHEPQPFADDSTVARIRVLRGTAEPNCTFGNVSQSCSQLADRDIQ